MKASFFLFLFAFLTACSAVPVLSEPDSGKVFLIRVGSKHVISLPENPTTGYSWQFSAVSDDKSVISDMEETYIAPDNRTVGAGGLKKYSFTARQKGTVTITGYYCRPWERPNRINREVIYTFVITD